MVLYSRVDRPSTRQHVSAINTQQIDVRTWTTMLDLRSDNFVTVPCATEIHARLNPSCVTVLERNILMSTQSPHRTRALCYVWRLSFLVSFFRFLPIVVHLHGIHHCSSSPATGFMPVSVRQLIPVLSISVPILTWPYV